MNANSVRNAQAPLRKKYTSDPKTAKIVDSAKTFFVAKDDPFHSSVEPMPGCGVVLPVGVHRALGGHHDAPTPGDILCAALSACQDSTIRMIANILGVELESLEVSVEADIDVRGTMMVDKQVPVGFQAMHCNVRLHVKQGTDPQLIERLKAAAEYSCVVLQTLRSPPPIEIQFTA
ncbi:MAG: OsmC family protein [Candidatus Thiodiazotropha sp. (ex Cardiolucina cf. quadrata)]|nr:OsmC family protein [Candidatus Thiodiazotropha sp. (ex Cardiolucina cf. quadrata)]